MFFRSIPTHKLQLPTSETALPGRDHPILVKGTHPVLGQSLFPPFPGHLSFITLGLGCFWGAERLFWSQPGVFVTAVGYAGGYTPNPTYEEVCSGHTGHTEVVRVVFDPAKIPLDAILKTFWEAHDPTQGMRQGNDVGTQYRSAIFCEKEEDCQAAQRLADVYAARLKDYGHGAVTTEIRSGVPFYYAEEYHQQYLHKHPDGYCGLRGTGVSCS